MAGLWQVIRGAVIREAGYASALSLVLSGTLMFVGGSLILAVQQNLAAANQQAEQYAALAMSELGMRQVVSMLQVAPRWGYVGPVKTLQRQVEAEGLTGTFTATVTNMGQQVQGSYPLVQIVSTGRVGEEERATTVEVYLKPPDFLRTALSVYESYTGQGPLITTGNVYVSGGFDHTGRLCIRGNLTADQVTTNGSGPVNQVPLECRGAAHNVTGTTVSNLRTNPAAFQSRPVLPLAWYVGAQKLLWEEIYGQSVPGTANLQWSTVVSNAAGGNYPYGILHVINGDFTIPDAPVPGQGWSFSGHATLVVTGTLRIQAKSIQYADAASHLQLISLGGISIGTGTTGPIDGLLYSYAIGQAGADAGNIWVETPGGQRQSLGALEFNGTLAAKTITTNGRIEIVTTDDRLRTSPAPAMPNLQVLLFERQPAAPGDEKAMRRWGLD